MPEKVSVADKQNKARFLKRVQIAVSIQQATVSYAAIMGPTGFLYPEDPHAICPDLMCNVDEFAMKLQDDFEKGRSRSAMGAIAAAKDDHIGVKGETSGLSSDEMNVSIGDVNVLEDAVKAAAEVKRRIKSLEKKRLKIIADNLAEGFDPNSELPPDDIEESNNLEEAEMILQEMLLTVEEMLGNKDFSISAGDTVGPAICEISGVPVKSNTFQARGITLEVMSNARCEVLMALVTIKERNCKSVVLQPISVSRGLYMIIRPVELSSLELSALMSFNECILPSIEIKLFIHVLVGFIFNLLIITT